MPLQKNSAWRGENMTRSIDAKMKVKNENRGQLVKKAFQQYYGNNKP